MLCGNIFEDWRMMMFLLHCGVGCQERWSWPCTMSRHGPRYFDVPTSWIAGNLFKPKGRNDIKEIRGRMCEPPRPWRHLALSCFTHSHPSCAWPQVRRWALRNSDYTVVPSCFRHFTCPRSVRVLSIRFSSDASVYTTTPLNTSWVDPRLCCFTKNSWTEKSRNGWKDKFEDGRIVVIGWDDLADYSADNNLKWWKKLKNLLITDFTINVLQKLMF